MNLQLVVTELNQEIDRLTQVRALLTAEAPSNATSNGHRTYTKRRNYPKTRRTRPPVTEETRRKISAGIKRAARQRRALKKASSKT